MLIVNIKKCCHVEVQEGMVRVVEVEDVTNLLNGLLKMEDKHLHTLASDALVTYADLVALTIQLEEDLEL